MDITETVQMLVAPLIVLFLPGMSWSYFILRGWNGGKKRHRTTMSFGGPTEVFVTGMGVSIALVPLAILFVNLGLQIRIDSISLIATVVILTLAPMGMSALLKAYPGKWSGEGGTGSTPKGSE